MPTLKIAKNSQLSPKDCFERVKKLLESDKDLHKLDPKISCEFNDQSLSGTATGSMFKAQMKISEVASGADISIDIDLPFHLALMKGMVQKTLEKKLDHILSS